VESAKLSQSKVSLEKKAQLLQLLMEWQHLKKAEEPLAQAVALVGQVKSFSKNKADLLYDTGDRINLSEKDALLEYQKVRLEEGLALVTAGLKSLLPSLDETTLASLPHFSVNYPLPAAAEMGNLYDAQSLDHQMNKMSEESSRGYVKVARWNRPWVPMVYSSASYSYTGDYHGETADGGWSVSLTLNFPLFDGFYSQARLQQANISAEASTLKTQAERDKRLLYLRHQRMKALVAGTQYRHLSLQTKKMDYRYQDVLKKRRQGLTSPLEVSGAGLELAQAQLEAYDKLKEHQQALLNVAVELNQWNQVEINEDEKP
jgi:outer membrane protein TolC